ncbi:low molecular weight protein-tyrosine-phosphatase [Neobacillus terrae]|uniref:low molecular weight protein-tyrosine-phosphatase n=1 Tax=Neobacillus terrae TaxID=3034837 RepID=UPI00140E1D54|nr:low molecular weight protein-tyrosine-phosphatase [Neobacillus terrae]NHM31119.1 low molecular weight phosphotyrosine protein phosphatase [Neobacillus terrae]
MNSILFVCHGNICRSPMAEALFRDLLLRNNLSTKVKVDSAGIGNWHFGKPPHQGTCEVLSKRKIPYENITARQITKEDFNKFDLIIVMDERNQKSIKELAGNKAINVHYLSEFITESDCIDIPDPYHTGEFEKAYQLIHAGCQGLLKKILSKEIL